MGHSTPPSILNDIMGPVMRGPSSSHTAGSFHIATLARALLGAPPTAARFTFDPSGSYAQVYRQQGVDRAFAMGLLGRPLTEAVFFRALDAAREGGVVIEFALGALPGADHPNAVEVELEGEGGRRISLRAKSVGGGAVEVTRLQQWPVSMKGQRHHVLVDAARDHTAQVHETLREDPSTTVIAVETPDGARVLSSAERREALPEEDGRALAAAPGVFRVYQAPPVNYGQKGHALFRSAGEMLRMAEQREVSLGRLALAYEAELLGAGEPELLAEMARRFEVMRSAVHEGLSENAPSTQLLRPSAGRIFNAEGAGRLAIGGLHTRAAARAMAVMHVNGAMGVVCAAPTGGSAGVLPGVLVTLVEERGMSAEQAALALFAASAIGVIVACRATFAAEVAGCQVEIGAAGAMAAAAVVEYAGGSARQAADAAAIAFQNTMGSVCDLVQGMVEIPCHTRNAAAAASAFVCADLVLGGYVNPIPLDETVDAVYAVGRMMPAELRCTARGGLATTPSALRLVRLERRT